LIARADPTDRRIRWVRAWPDPERPRFRVGRLGADLIADWPGVATLAANRAGTRCDYRLVGDALAPAVAAKFHAGQVRGLLRHLQGELTLHAAAVALDGAGVLLVGDSGAGKSSLAAALCSHHGADFIADDIAGIVLGPPRVVRLETHHWLLPQSRAVLGLGTAEAAAKEPSTPARLAVEPARLVAIVLLDFDDRASAAALTPRTGRAVFAALNGAAIRFVVDEPGVALHDFDQIASLAAEVPSFRLSRPRSAGGLLGDAALVRQRLRALALAQQEDPP
jgi:hypothetical protein